MKTQRISSIGIRPMIALIAVLFALVPITAQAQLSGIKTVGTGGIYTTIAAAIADLNLVGVGPGGVTFNVAAGHTETTTSVLEITATGVAGNPIIFQKSGAGANPMITRTDAGLLATSSMSADGDAVIKVLGGDYITFDGLDVSATDQGIEYGYYLTKPSATDGCQNVTIQNCNINMTKGTSGFVVGILVGNGSTSVSAPAGLTVTALSGINSDILIKGNTISNVHAGIYLRGSSATGFYDNNITVGAPGAPNTIWNYGGGNTGVTYGVYLIQQNNSNVSYNIIDNTAGGGVSATGGMYGIFHSTGTNSNFTANYNDINVTQGATSGILYGINTAATGNLTVNNNTIALNTTATSSGIFGYIYNSSAAASTAVNISNNTFLGTSFATTGSTYLIFNNSSQLTPGVTNISNNTVSGTLTRSGASGTFWGYYNNGSPTGTENFFNNDFSNITLAGSSTFYGVQSTTAANQTQNHYNNTFSNIQGGTGIMYGLHFTIANTRNVYGNEISNFTGGGAVYGISNGSGNGTNIYQNNIFNLSSTATATTAGLVTGILLSSGNSTVYNNFISDLKAPNTAAVDGIRGIGITSTLATSTNKIYHNTIFLDANSIGANFGTSGIFHTYSLTATTSVLDMRNNIVVNQSVANGTGVTAAFRRSASTNLNNLSVDCNNNCFFVTGTGLVYFDGTNSDATIGDFKLRVAPREAMSFSELPPFVNIASSPYDLHLTSSTPTQCESGGQSIAGITTDFDGNLRFGAPGYTGTGTAPDVGADEGNFLPLDLIPPAISFTTLQSTGFLTPRTLTTTITDASGVPTSGIGLPVLYWNINAGPFTPVTGVWVSGDTYTFTFGGGVAINDVVNYYIVARDLNSPPNIGANPSVGAAGFQPNPPSASVPPTTPHSYSILPSIAGVFQVGVGMVAPNYPTITDAVADYNAKFQTGPVTFLLMDPNYSTSETFPITINQNPGSSAVNTLTIKPNTGQNVVVSGSSTTNNSILKLNGADNTIIDGSNGIGNTRNLTWENTSTLTNTAAIWVTSLGTNLGAENNTIKNCMIKAGSSTVTSTFGIHAGGTSISISGTGAHNDDLVIENNEISRAYYAIYARGVATTGMLTGFVAKNNLIGSNTVSDYVLFKGIDIQNATAPLIQGNEIFNLKLATSVNNAAIDLGGTLNDGIVDGNEIYGIYSTSTGGWGAYGINIASTTTNNITISNNIIYDIITANYSTTSTLYNAFGIRIAGGTNHKVYHNSINLFGAVTSGTSAGMSAPLVVTVTSATGLDVRNNIFANSTSFLTVGSKCYTVFVPSGFVFGTINNNCYYPSGPYAIVGFYGSDRLTLADWQTSSGQDVNSLNVDPIFGSNTNLKPASISLNNAGALLPVLNDFFGILRNQPPDIGAIEFTPPLNDAGVFAIASPIINTPIGSAPIVVDLRNYGINALTSVNIHFQVNGGTITTFPWTGNLASNTILPNVTIGTFNFVDYNSTIKAWTSLPNNTVDEDNTNDTSTTTLFVCNPLAGVYTVGSIDFPTIASAFERLNTCGVGGPVVFNIPAGYTEAITLAASPNNFGLRLTATGTAVNTITFQKSGAGVNPLITFTGTSATTDAGIWLDGSDYVTFNGIDLNDAGTAMERGFYLAGSATNGCVGNIIKNCSVTLSNTSSNTNTTGIQLVSVATAPSGKNSNNQFLNNNISNVFYGYRINGVSAQYDEGNIIGNENNGIHIIQNVGYNGAATTHGINISFQNDIEIHNVKIENILNTSTTSPNNCGIQISGACSNINIHHNHINLMSGGEPYGINFGGACAGINTFNNNLFENFTATAGNMNLFRNEGSALGTMSIFNNTFRNMTHNGTANSIEGFYMNSATTFTVYNNQIYGWVNNGTGAANINPLNIMNASNNSTVYNNMIYDLQAPSSTATPSTKGIRVNAGTVKLYHNTIVLNYTSLVAGNSSAAIHVSAAPTSLEMINNIIINKCDMTTGTRAVAFWWPSATYTALANTTNNNIYYAGMPGAKNLIFWNGTAGDQTLADYQLRMVTRDQASLTEDVPFVNTAIAPWDVHVQQFIPTLVESQGFKMPVVTHDIDGQLRFGEPGYVGTGVAVDIGADEITGIPIFTCSAPTPGNTIASKTAICLGETVLLSLQNVTSGTGVTYQWRSSTDGIIYSDIPGANFATLNVSPGIPTWYFCNVKCFNGPVTTSSTPVNITFATSITGTTPGTRCGLGTVTLGATANAGTVNWYSGPVGGAPLGTGNSFITPVINTTTDFYAAAANTAPALVTLGTGGTASISVGQTFFPGAWGGAKTQYIIRANELIAAGLSAGPITSLGFTPTTSGQTYQGFYVNIGHTTESTAPTSTFIASGLSLVYAGTLPDDGYLPDANILNTLAFGTGSGAFPVFVWDGVSNIVISISWSRVPAATTATGSTMLVDNVGFASSAYRQRDNLTPADMMAETLVNTTTTFRPQFAINGISVCSGPRVPVTATVTPAPAITATALSYNLCDGESTTLSVTSPNDPNYTYTWNPGSLVGPIQVVTPSATTTYTLMATDNSGLGNNGCVNTADVVINVHPVPTPVMVTPVAATACEGQIVQLNASGGMIPAQPTSIGTGTVQNGSSSYPTPYGAYYETVRQQYLVLASELMAAGITAGGSLTSVAFEVTALNGALAHGDYKIRLAHTAATALGLPLLDPVLQQVFGPVNYQPVLGSNIHVFTAPFVWDGTSNLLVDICFSNDPTGTGGNLWSNNASVNSTTTAFNSAAWIYTDDADYCGLTSGINTAFGATRANMLFGATGATSSEWAPQAGLYTDAAATVPYVGGTTSTIFAKPTPGIHTYTYSAVSPQNCTSSGSSTLTIDPLPTATTTLASTEYICPGGTKVLSVDLTGTPPWSITVGDGSGTTVVPGIMTTPWIYPVSPAVATTYTVTSVTDANCTNTASLSVMVDFHPVPAPAITGYSSPICSNSSTTLNAGAGFTTYLWSDNSTGQTLVVNGSDIGGSGSSMYTVTVTNVHGCAGTASATITTYPTLQANAGLDVAICINDNTQLDANGVAGSGIYTSYSWSPAVGLSATNIKNPVANPVVTTTYTVTIVDDNGCVATDEIVVTVNPLPVVSFTGLNAAYCVDAPMATLTGIPAGGTFAGTGIIGNSFSPAAAGVGGPYTITYTYTDANTCTNSYSETVTVNPLPVVSIDNLLAGYCIDVAPFALAGTPVGGTFSGPGVAAGMFNPALAGAGVHTLTYTYMDGNGCINSTTANTTVWALPVLSIDNVGAGYCIDVPAFTLFATPFGGTFSGTGVVAGMFDPSVAGAGTHTITYAYTDGNGCFNTVSINTDVYALPVVTFAALSDVCVDAAPVVLSQGAPAGGTYSGTGVSAGTFDPAVATVGNHTLTYTYVDGNFCINSATQTIQVNALPVMAFPALTSICITVPEFALNTATPAGGTYTGPGVAANMFNPAVAGAGVHTITYTYTDGNNCTNSITQTIEVFALPSLVMTANPTICAGFSAPIGVTATGAGGFTYVWDNVALLNDATIANPTATPAITTTFMVTVTDVNLCVNTGSVTVNVNQLPVIALDPNVDQCHGYTTQLNAVVTPAGSYTYAWSNAGSLSNGAIANPIASPVVTTTYTVSVTNTATTCVNTAAIVVTVLPNPIPTITGLSANYCFDAAPVVLTGTPAGGTFTIGGVTVTQFDPTALSTGTHTVVYTYTNPNNCVASVNQIVTVRDLPSVNAGADQSTCAGLPVFLSASTMGGTAPYTYAWTPAGSLSNASIHNPVATTLVDETYTVTVTDFYGCQGTDQVTVFATAIPVANVSPNVAICIGQSTPLQASGGDVFSWSPTYGLSNPNSASPIASPVATTTYTVTVSSICGVATNSVVVTVNPLPAVIFIGLPTSICVDAPIQTLTGGPNGGTFTGTGMVGNHFNPALAGVGGPYNIVYTYTDGNGCTNSSTQPVTVRPLPTLTITGLSAGYCLTAPTAALTLTPAGGTLSGPGIVGTMFDPALAGLGTHTITYTYTDGFNCTNSITRVVRVDQPVSFTGLAAMYCNDNPIVTLTGIPAGGTFSGLGIVGNTFNPAVVPLGNRTITYTMPLPYYCANSASQVTMINALPSAAFSGLNLVHGHCVSLTAVPLTGHPVGGVFTGNGITGNVFSPAMAGVGNHVITYTYADPNGCAKSVSQTVTVKPLPVVSFTGLAGPYCVNYGTVTLTGTPAGGTFSGPGITGNTFNTMLAGAGMHTINYSYTDNLNCANSISQTVMVNALPVVTLAPLAPVCAGAPQITLTGGMPAGGSYSGTGVLGNVFHPSIAGVGTHTITYTYINPATGCTGTASINMVIHPNPVANAGNDTSVFVGTKATLLGSATGGLGSYGYSWTPAALVQNPNAFSTQTVNMTTSQVFTLTVTDLQTGCTTADQKIVNVVGSPLDVMITGVPTTICQGASATLTAIATGGSTNYTVYSWSSVPSGSYLPTSAITVTPMVTTTYKVKVYDGFNWDSAMVTINVNPTPVVAINPLPASLCIGSANLTLTGTPAGGTFSGPGVIGNTFNPNFAGVGIHTLTYFYTSGAGCSNSTTASIQVFPAPGVTIASTPPAVCVNAAPLTLAGTPTGGTFSGPGISGNTFNPAIAGVGIKTITYTFTNSGGCTNTATRTITVNALPTVAFVNLASNYCANGSTVTLYTNQVGGVFTGPGVGANTFSPVSAGTGVKTLTYTYTDGNGCTNSTSQNVTVNALPTLAFTGLQTQYCVNAAPVTLAATPAGGTFSGIGVTGTSLNPSVAGVGTTSVTYNYTSPTTGCSNTISANINIRPLPVIGISVPNANPCINGATVTLTGSPAGGTFSGSGMTGNVFNPTTAGVGAKVITYTATNSYGCSASGTTTIHVQALPTVSVGGLATSYCLPSTQVVALAGIPSGGVFTGPGVSGNTFNPQAAGLGAKTVTYTYTNQYGCSNTATANTTVNTTVANFTGLGTSYCVNSASVTLSGTPTGGSFSGGGIAGSTFNPATAGVGGHNITYTVTNAATGCTGVVTKYTVVHGLPNVSILNMPNDFCINSAPFTVITSPATGGTLSGPGITGNVFNAATAGLGTKVITYTFTNSNGCTVTATKSVVVQPLPFVSFTGLTGPFCANDPSVSLTGSPAGGTFSGNGIQSGNKFNPMAAQPGNHTVTYTYANQFGCVNTSSQPVTVYANPVVDLGPDTTICVNHVITLDAGPGFNSYLWSTGATTQTIVVNAAPLLPGWHHYTVTVTNSNNCEASDRIRVIVLPCTGIEEPGDVTLFEVYPNPTTGIFNLTIHNAEATYQMDIYNDLGQIIHKESLITNQSARFTREVNLSAHPTGMYFIRLQGERNTKVVKVVVN